MLLKKKFDPDKTSQILARIAVKGQIIIIIGKIKYIYF